MEQGEEGAHVCFCLTLPNPNLQSIFPFYHLPTAHPYNHTHAHTPVLPDEGVEGVAIGHPSNETAVGGKRDDGVPEGGHIRGKGVGKVVRINRI